MMTRYTLYQDGRDAITGLTAEEAATEILVYDSYTFEIRKDDDYNGLYELYVSTMSAAAHGGPGVMTSAHIDGGLVLTIAETYEQAWHDIAIQVLHNDWPRVPACMTDGGYERMMSNLAADESESSRDPRDPDYPDVTYLYRCPSCGDAHHIDVVVSSWIRLLPQDQGDSFTDMGDIMCTDPSLAQGGEDDWNENSTAVCRRCDHAGDVSHFTNPKFQAGVTCDE